MQNLFNIVCLAVEGRTADPREGTSLPQLRTLLSACQNQFEKDYKWIGEELDIKVDYPFSGNGKPKSNKEYLRGFVDPFSCSGALCGILGMEDPQENRITFENRKWHLALLNSDANGERWQIA